MQRRRRQLLGAIGVAAVGGLAGCTSSSTDTPTGGSSGSTEGSSGNMKLLPDSVGENDRMGNDLALSADGTTAIVGAVGDVTTGDDTGQAFLFEWDGEAWNQVTEITPDEQDAPGLLGFSVALSTDGSTALVGVPAGARESGPPPGTVYVLTNDGGEWTRETKLTSAQQRPGERFGLSAALSADGTTALIGANPLSRERPNDYLDGSAHVLERVDGTWEHRVRLTAVDREDAHQFGMTAALSADGTTALLGATNDTNENGDEAGAVYVFADDNRGWSQQAKLLAEGGESNGQFGSAVALSADGTLALLGDYLDDTDTGENSGSVSVFEADGGSWTQQATIVPDAVDANARFGSSVALSPNGTKALVGSQNGERTEQDGEQIVAGAVHLLETDGSGWTQREKYATLEGRAIPDSFGTTVDISGDGETGLVGATQDPEQGLTSGAAYVVDLSDG